MIPRPRATGHAPYLAGIVAIVLIFALLVLCRTTSAAVPHQHVATATTATPPTTKATAPTGTSMACDDTLLAGSPDSTGVPLPLGAQVQDVGSATPGASITRFTVTACAASVFHYFHVEMDRAGWTALSEDKQDTQQYQSTYQRGGTQVQIVIVGYGSGGSAGTFVVVNES